MNQPISTNLCTRCGKPRIDGKVWKETIQTYAGSSVVIHTQTICPDSNCQKLVEAHLAEQKAKSEKIKADFDQRALDKKTARAQIHFAKAKKPASI